MAELDEKLQSLLKNKKILIPAIAIGAIAGLYMLSKQGAGGGAGAGGGGQPLPGQPDAGGGGGEGGGADIAGLQGQIAELIANRQNDQSALQQALQAIQDGFNNALGNQSAQNQSALQSVIDQVNSQLASGQYTQGATVPDFAGFQSQLQQALSGINNTPLPTLPTGTVFKNMTEGGRVFAPQKAVDWASLVRPPNTQTAAPRSFVGNLLSGINRVSGYKPAVPSPNIQRLAALPGRPTWQSRSPFGSLGSSGANSLRSLNSQWSRGFNSLSSGGGNRGVPFNIGSSYTRYVQGKAKVPTSSVGRYGGLTRSPFARR